jgi:hypothetical protein
MMVGFRINKDKRIIFLYSDAHKELHYEKII